MRGSAAVKAGALRALACSAYPVHGELFVVERLGGAEKERRGGKATTT